MCSTETGEVILLLRQLRAARMLSVTLQSTKNVCTTGYLRSPLASITRVLTYIVAA